MKNKNLIADVKNLHDTFLAGKAEEMPYVKGFICPPLAARIIKVSRSTLDHPTSASKQSFLHSKNCQPAHPSIAWSNKPWCFSLQAVRAFAPPTRWDKVFQQGRC